MTISNPIHNASVKSMRALCNLEEKIKGAGRIALADLCADYAPTEKGSAERGAIRKDLSERSGINPHTVDSLSKVAACVCADDAFKGCITGKDFSEVFATLAWNTVHDVRKHYNPNTDKSKKGKASAEKASLVEVTLQNIENMDDEQRAVFFAMVVNAYGDDLATAAIEVKAAIEATAPKIAAVN